MTAMRDAREPAAPAPPAGVLAPFIFTLRTKGAVGLATRVTTVATRFGPTPHFMRRRLGHMIDEAARLGFRPTCPITATVLARNPDMVCALADRGMEIAVHGLRHNDHLAQDASVQLREIEQAVATFRRWGIEPAGFRAPYLRADEGTRSAVRAVGLAYESDDAVVFDIAGLDDVGSNDAYRRATVMYDAQPASITTTRPSLDRGLVRIPVCIPDDEMLVDRLRLPDQVCGRAWCEILDVTHARGDLFTMQVHPERFLKSVAGVRVVLNRAASLGGIWTARLDEIAQWWLARDRCRIERRAVVHGSVTYALVGDTRARMRLVGGAASAERRPARTLTVPADRLPAIAVSRDVPTTVRRFLEEDGFLVLTEPQVPCAVELSGTVDAADQIALRRRVLSTPHALLAMDRWPYGSTSALALTGDIDALTIQDFAYRMRDNVHGAPSWITGAAT